MSSAAVGDAKVIADRKRRWRMLIILGSISIGWKVLVFTLGAALPKWLIDDGVALVPVERQAYARSALSTSRGLWNGRIERYGFVRAVRVVRVDSVSSGTCNGLGARIRAYTYFAIPYSEVQTRCESGEVLYRVFKRKGGSGTGVGER